MARKRPTLLIPDEFRRDVIEYCREDLAPAMAAALMRQLDDIPAENRERHIADALVPWLEGFLDVGLLAYVRDPHARRVMEQLVAVEWAATGAKKRTAAAERTKFLSWATAAWQANHALSKNELVERYYRDHQRVSPLTLRRYLSGWRGGLGGD